MEFDYFAEEALSPEGRAKTVHYLFNASEGLIIQTSGDGFCRRNDPLLHAYLTAVLGGRPLPGFAHLGKITISDQQIKPVIDVLSYKVFVEQKLERVNRAISAQAGRILGPLGELAQGRLSS